MEISSLAAVAAIANSGIARHGAAIAMIKQTAEAEKSMAALVEQATDRAKQASGHTVDIVV